MTAFPIKMGNTLREKRNANAAPRGQPGNAHLILLDDSSAGGLQVLVTDPFVSPCRRPPHLGLFVPIVLLPSPARNNKQRAERCVMVQKGLAFNLRAPIHTS
ncbi:hypothetical protein BCR44DRAFT_393753 [Catenaria anguillulae PL171]|uniref:Uncharacterized protein n=1 Tax=Catenaria anguillulae PL171 TaxID=765915 RepID=A0A1Y2GZ13_9FUNG|nr:hypothetical protein BCR44DRAFT_393753 [Catenaria anguillulae PL171]